MQRRDSGFKPLRGIEEARRRLSRQDALDGQIRTLDGVASDLSCRAHNCDLANTF